MEGAKAIAAVLKDTQLSELGLSETRICGLNWRGEGTYTAEGITALCEGLRGSAVTSLE